MEDRDLYWLAGLIEGEGSFGTSTPKEPSRIKISVEMTDEDVIARVARLFGNTYTFIRRREEHYKDTWAVRISGSRAYELMVTLRPLMSIRRQGQIDKALASYQPIIRTVIEESDYPDIAVMLKSGMTHQEIADHYGVERSTISQVKRRKLGKLLETSPSCA